MLMTEGSWGKFNVKDSTTQVAWLSHYMLLRAGLRSTTNLEMASWFCWGDSTFGWGDLGGNVFPIAPGTAVPIGVKPVLVEKRAPLRIPWGPPVPELTS